MRKLNLGCGRDYRDGCVNVDFNLEVRADLYADLSVNLPFADDSIDEVLLDNVLEHIPRPRYFLFMDDLYRVCKAGARISVYVPHYSGMYAFKHPAHYVYFGVGTMHLHQPEILFSGERYSKARFNVVEERLLFFHHNLVNHRLLSKLPINWLFNFSLDWKQLMERFQFFGFDEIYYSLEVVK
jgi:Methyltransferase domain